MALTGTAKLRFRLLKQRQNQIDRLKLVRELTQGASAHLLKNLSTVSGRTLANTLRSLADLELNSDQLQKLLEGTAVQLKDRTDDFNTQERCMIVGTFAAQRIFPGHIINECVNRVCYLPRFCHLQLL